LKINKPVLAFFLLINSTVIEASACNFGDRASEIDIFSLDNLSIKIDLNYRKYVKNIFKILSAQEAFIGAELKSYNKADIVIGANGRECSTKAKVRLTGDFKDHIDKENIITSLKLKLKNKSLSNIVKLKLLNPESRFGLNEIMLSALLRQYGVISPRTTFAAVQVGKSKKLMLLQEDHTKEMMEYNKKREDFLIKGSETIGNILLGTNPPKEYTLFEIDNKKYADKSHRHISALDTLREVNNIIQEGSSINWPFLDHTNSFKFQDFSIFYLILAASEAGHAAVFYNNHLYYDSALKKFTPVYYDGNVRPFDFGVRYFIGEEAYSKILLNANAEAWSRAISVIDNILSGAVLVPEFEQIKRYQSSFMGNLHSTYLEKQLKDRRAIERFLNKIRSNLIEMQVDRIAISSMNVTPPSSKHSINLSKLKLKNNLRSIYIDRSYIDALKNKNNSTCLNSDLFDVCEAMDGGISQDRAISNLKHDNSSARPISIYIARGDPVISPSSSYELKFGSGNTLEILNFNPDRDSVFVSAEVISIHCEKRCQVVIKNAKLKNIKIEIDYALRKKAGVSFSEFSMINGYRNLSGGLNIIESELDNVSIRVANAQWEDAFNCIRCSGNISDIEVRNAVSDGVDIDFSDLELGSVVVLASGNDCVDVSSGKYLIHELKAEACGDKALSIGEASQMSVRNLQVTRASIGIAIKDSSVLYRPENYRDLFNFVDVITDFATYNKKQEYGTGRIIETTQY
jgi:hypothetical protein